jgi:hypothetical protein
MNLVSIVFDDLSGVVDAFSHVLLMSALKFTVAKYYTPSGRCIQGVQYKEGGGLREEDGMYLSSRVSKKDRQVFYTKSGRVVRDGGGIEADYKVPAPKASALEVTLLRSDVMNEFASEWSKKYELRNNFEVTDDVYRDFQDFVEAKRQSGDIKLEGLYSGGLEASAETEWVQGIRERGGTAHIAHCKGYQERFRKVQERHKRRHCHQHPRTVLAREYHHGQRVEDRPPGSGSN